jgi:hypothetical protein
MQPPRDLLVEIRALQDCGEIMTENGPVNLDSGSTHFLKRYYKLLLIGRIHDIITTINMQNRRGASYSSGPCRTCAQRIEWTIECRRVMVGMHPERYYCCYCKKKEGQRKAR